MWQVACTGRDVPSDKAWLWPNGGLFLSPPSLVVPYDDALLRMPEGGSGHAAYICLSFCRNPVSSGRLLSG